MKNSLFESIENYAKFAFTNAGHATFRKNGKILTIFAKDRRCVRNEQTANFAHELREFSASFVSQTSLFIKEKSQIKVKSLKGNISLSTVLVTSSMLLILGVSLILSISDYSNYSKDYFNNELNQLQSNSCLEEAVMKIKNNTLYTGTFQTTLPSGNCTITILIDGTNPNIRNVSILSQLDKYYYSINRKVDISVSPFAVSS